MTTRSDVQIEERHTTILTVETIFWVALGLVALLLRLNDLGRIPLAEREAAHALAAFNWVNGLPYQLLGAASPTTLSPLGFNLEALTFAILGASDATARLASALAGTGVVLSPWLLRPVLGRGPMLGASLLLLLSPSVLFFSRHATAEALGVLAAMLFLAGSVRWWHWRAPHDGLLAAVALGLGLASVPAFWGLLVAGGLFLLVERRRTREMPVLDPATEQPWLRRGAVVAGVTFLVASSGVLLNLPGVGAALNLPVTWVRELFGAGLAPLALPFFLTFLLYEFLIVVAAVFNLTFFVERHPRWATFLLLWAALSLIPATVGNSGWSGGVLWAALPLALLGGGLLARLASGLIVTRQPLAVAGIGLLTLVSLGYLIIVLPRYLGSPSWLDFGRLAVVPLLWLVVVLASREVVGAALARRAALASVLLVLALLSFGSARGLSMVRGSDPREPLVTAPTHPNLRAVREELSQLSFERYRNATTLPIEVDPSFGHGVRWYVRDFPAGRDTPPEAALRPTTAEGPPGWIGTPFWHGASWSWNALNRSAALPWLFLRADDRLPVQWAEGRLFVRLQDAE